MISVVTRNEVYPPDSGGDGVMIFKCLERAEDLRDA